MQKEQILVREIRSEDIPYIVNYWTKSEEDYLISLGVELDKVPKAEDLEQMLTKQLQLVNREKQNYALIVLADKTPIGHVNINEITFGHSAKMHLHIWTNKWRKGGVGTKMLHLSIPIFFDQFNLKKIICEPYAENKAPNSTLKKVGFQFVKKYTTTPGSITFRQEVNQWELSVKNLVVFGEKITV